MKLYKSFVILMLFLPFTMAGEQENYGFVVIVNSKNPISSMTRSEVKLTYLRKINKRWPGINKNIIPVDRKELSETKKIFLAKLINMSEQDMARYFTEREYMNAEMPPITFSSDAEIINYVSNNIGAIAYVSVGSINGADKGNIKVVFP